MANYRVLLSMGRVSFVRLVREVDNDSKAFQFFCDIGVINFSGTKCECGVRGINFFTKNIHNEFKCGFLLRCKICKARVNPLKNTFFEKSKLSYLKVFEIVLHWFYRLRIEMVIDNVECHSEAVVDWNTYCREVCQVAIINQNQKIGGPGHWVEIDETCLFRRKYNRGHRIRGESIWMFGGIDRDTKQRFIVRVPNRRKTTLWPIIKKHVARGTILCTDDSKSYVNIDKCRWLGLASHEVVTHKYNFVSPSFPEVYTNNVECVWGKLKNLARRSGSDRNVDLYVAEFLYRCHLKQLFGNRQGPKLLQFYDDVRKVYPGPNRRGYLRR